MAFPEKKKGIGIMIGIGKPKPSIGRKDEMPMPSMPGATAPDDEESEEKDEAATLDGLNSKLDEILSLLKGEAAEDAGEDKGGMAPGMEKGY